MGVHQAWYKSDTTQSINYLKDKVVDVGITYTQSAEEVAINEQIAQVSVLLHIEPVSD